MLTIIFSEILSADATHYAIPDVSSLSDYLEVFEQPGITGCILLQSALTHVSRHLTSIPFMNSDEPCSDA